MSDKGHNPEKVTTHSSHRHHDLHNPVRVKWGYRIVDMGLSEVTVRSNLL